jgi:hypothetical protein
MSKPQRRSVRSFVVCPLLCWHMNLFQKLMYDKLHHASEPWKVAIMLGV